MTYEIDFGKYKNKQMTVEDLLFLDYSYIHWMKTTFDPAEFWVNRICELEMIARQKPIIVECDSMSADLTRCKLLPTFIGIPVWNDIIYTKNAVFSCEFCKSNLDAWRDYDGLYWYEISFQGLEKYLLDNNANRSQVATFARKLAEAWGILDAHGRLTKVNIRTFFEHLKQ